MSPMAADLLRGHLDGLLLAVLAAAPGHGYEFSQRLKSAAEESSASTRARCIPRCTGWSAAGSSRVRGARATGGAGGSIIDVGGPPRRQAVAAGVAGVLGGG